ncbi:hypothetical protein RB195_016895 [Necator americanus]|uniref:G-protein coupled receptors family 1 profile domain-containing protein n=1 Tax=Necator americanus TaxID=51031 RepID=A0ABR1C2M9_NECAM
MKTSRSVEKRKKTEGDQITVGDGAMFVFLSTGFGGYGEYGFVGLLLFFIGCLLVLLLSVNSFLYRYILLCRNDLAFIYTKKRYLVLVFAVNSLIVADWTHSTLRTMPATAELTRSFRQSVLRIVQIDITYTAHFGYDQTVMGKSPIGIFCMLQFFIIMVLVFNTIVYCIYKIMRTLKRAAISENSRKLHSRMFNLLILQV